MYCGQIINFFTQLDYYSRFHILKIEHECVSIEIDKILGLRYLYTHTYKKKLSLVETRSLSGLTVLAIDWAALIFLNLR